MSGLLAFALLVGAFGPAERTGDVTYYAPGVMERTYRNRLAMGHVEPCPACAGMVAIVGGPEHLGRQVWLRRPGRPVEGPFLVVDCSNGAHLARQRARGLVAEVDYQTARRWRMRGPLAGVTVLFGLGAPKSGAESYHTTLPRQNALRPS